MISVVSVERGCDEQHGFNFITSVSDERGADDYDDSDDDKDELRAAWRCRGKAVAIVPDVQ